MIMIQGNDEDSSKSRALQREINCCDYLMPAFVKTASELALIKHG